MILTDDRDRESSTAKAAIRWTFSVRYKNKGAWLISNVLFIASEFGKGSYRNDSVIHSKYAIILSDYQRPSVVAYVCVRVRVRVRVRACVNVCHAYRCVRSVSV